MRSADQIDVIFLQETFDNSLAECVANATVVLTPASLALFRVRPEQIAQKSIFGYFGRPCYLLELSDSD